jgi:Protein of unknown function (DUF2974)
MALSKEKSLFLAILALDAYNRNYNPGYKAVQQNTSTVAVKGSAIGDAYVVDETKDEDVSFYALSYKWGTDTVVSYRGTTFEAGPNTNDVLYGWTMSFGWGAATQGELAKAFYDKTKVGLTNSPILLTGHSLGGGLAGFVAAQTGAEAAIFNNIGFGNAVVSYMNQVNLFSLSGILNGPSSLSNINQFITENEIAWLTRRYGPGSATWSLIHNAVFGPIGGALALRQGQAIDQ